MKKKSLALLAVAMTVLSAPAVHADEVSGDQLVDGLNDIFGKYPKTRGSHAKGLCVMGTFTPSPDAAKLSKVPFLASAVPVLGRFSFGGGDPKASDLKRSPRGLAVRFDPDGKAPTDFVMLSAPIFFAKTPEEALAFFQALKPGPDKKPDPAKLKAHAEAYPWAFDQKKWVDSRPIPASYATLPYFSIHAFKATAADGAATAVKFKLVPEAGELGLTDEEAAAKGEGFFTADIDARMAKGPVAFDLVAIVGTDADPTDNPTAEWPEADRTKMQLGKLAITGRTDEAACDATTFDPNNLASGLEGFEGDKILPVRATAYAVSLSRRSE
ncbi:MAG: catalase family peroxidase [Hyphomicrobium sp.]|nr:catalase family peroxidase [Hyphomicrobium sp.]